jgi:hypothetical protein
MSDFTKDRGGMFSRPLNSLVNWLGQEGPRKHGTQA